MTPLWGGLSVFAYMLYGASISIAWITHDQGLLAVTLFGATAWTFVVGPKIIRK